MSTSYDSERGQHEWYTPDEVWPGFEPPTPPAPPSLRSRGVALGLVAALLAVAIGAGLGATFGLRGLERTAAPGTETSTPAAPAEEATGVAAGVVDVTTTIGYAGGSGAGTGFVTNDTGRVLTANHVVEGATTIKVQVGGAGPRYDATVVGTDEAADVAVLQIDGGRSLKAAKLGDSSTVSPGDDVVAVGNAGGQGQLSSVQGRVVALNQTITVSDVDGTNPKTLHGLIQSTTPLEPGDSGGPLLNTAGEVIGVDTAALSSASGRFQPSHTVSFAIPINTALAVAARVEKRGGTATTSPRARGAMLGVQVLGVADALDQVGYDAPVGAGAVVVGVGSGTPAEEAGIAAGDVIVAIDGTKLGSPASLSSTMRSHEAGDKVRIAWVDPEGRSHSATVTLAAAP